MKRIALILLLLALSARGATLRVSAAASLTDVMREIAQHSSDSLVFNFGSSSLLARQIVAGAPADVFISADEAKMDQLQTRAFIDRKTRRDILSNTLVIVVASDSGLKVSSANDLVDLRKIAIAEPQTVPAGIYAKEYLRKAGVWSRITQKIVPTDNVRGALAAVESGNVDAGIVYKTDAQISRSVRIAFEVPKAEGPKILYPAAVVADSREKAAAARFVAFLSSDAARAIFRKYGFILP